MYSHTLVTQLILKLLYVTTKNLINKVERLCQYNKTQLAWVFLVFPVIYLLIQNLIVHIHVSSAVQSAPKEIDAVSQQQQYLSSGAKIVPQDTQQSQPPMVPPMKQPDRPNSTSISQPLGGSNMGGSQYAYF